MSEVAVEDAPAVAVPAREAASGEVIYITERGERIAGIVPAELAAALERWSADDLGELSAAADNMGRPEIAELLEDLADRAAAREARASIEAGEPVVPWAQVRSESGL